MDLVQMLWDRMHRVEDVHAVRVLTTRSPDGEIIVHPLEIIRADNRNHVRKSRTQTEINDFCIPYLEDSTNRAISIATAYRRRITYFFGIRFSDRPVLEHTIEYDDGRIREMEA